VKDEPHKQERFFRLGEEYFWFSSQNAIVERVLGGRLAPLEGGRRPLRLLDVGCGPGNVLRRLERWGHAFGSDFSLDALAFARSKGMRRLLSSDSTALPFASCAFDVVVALDVLEHIADDRAALHEIARVLRPGGVFVFAVPAFMALWRHHDVMYGHFRRYVRAEFIAEVLGVGLTVERCEYIKCAFFVPLLAIALAERVGQGSVPQRDNFYRVLSWLNIVFDAQIRWEHRLGLGRWLPFGVSLLCVGRR